MDLMLLETSTGISQKGRPRTVPGLPLRLETNHPSEGPSPRSGLTGVCSCLPELRTPPPPNIHTWATTPVTPVLYLGSPACHHTLPCTSAR
uniref:Non-SMC condensin II complex subunit H2 n=1 Tax=Pan troglodytes TaxID=9598 RepID=K7CZR2_PANTR